MYSHNNLNLKPEEIIMYLRKSRADDPMLSVAEVLSKHEKILDEWTDKNLPAPIPEENRFREVVSGGDSIADRPEFQKVLKLVERPSIRAVLVVEISRLGRPDTEEIGRLTKIFRYTNCLVITPMMIFDIANEYERDMFERELKRGQEYLEYTKKRLRAGRELSVKNGNCVISRGIYGYDKITVIEDKRKCPTLAVNEEQANIVRMIFNAYVNENVGTQTIANRLNDMKIKSPRGNLWSADSIRTVLENIHYIGMVRWNQRKSVIVVDNGEFRKTRPISNDDDVILCKGKHQAIISEELFNAAQEKRGRSHKTPTSKELKNPLASLLFCECGRGMSYRLSTRGDKKYRSDPRLVCNAQHICGNGSCSVTEMTDFVKGVLRREIKSFKIEAKKADDGKAEYREDMIKNLEKKLSDIDAKELQMWESQLTENRIPPHIFKALTEKLTNEREDTKKALEKIRAEIVTPMNIEKKIITFQKALTALEDDTVSASEKNMLLKSCINRITYSREIPKRIGGKGNGSKMTPTPIKVDISLKV